MPMDRTNYRMVITVKKGKTDKDEIDLQVKDNCEDDNVRKTIFHALFLTFPEISPYLLKDSENG